MSADMFPQPPTTPNPSKQTNESRIPVPASPIPFRRHNSMRLRGEKEPANKTTSAFFPAASRDLNRLQESARKDNNHPHSTPENVQQSALDPRLRRVRSFMERGENRENYGGRLSSSGVGNRPQHVKISPKASTPVKCANSPQSPSRLRSLSLSLSNTRINSPKSSTVVTSSPNNPISPNSRNFSTGQLTDFWDSESITSIGSSVASCDHASVARNGTTFSGRSMKYVFHCNQHSGATGEDYLTPTQRAHRQVKKLKHLLHQARKELEQKDSDILKLTKEVVELRLYKAALHSPEDKSQSNSSDAVTVKENASDESTPEADMVDESATPNQPANEFNGSFADSGHFEDGTNSSVHSKDSVLFDDIHRSPYKSGLVETTEKGITAHIGMFDHGSEQSKLIMEYEKRIQELVRTHEEETYQLKQKHNDKIEELLQRITEINTRYWDLVPEMDTAKDRIKELEQQLEQAIKKLEEQEETAKQTCMKTYSHGQEAPRFEQENTVMELARQNPSRVSVPELLQELQVTKNELDNIKAMYRQLMEAKSKNKIDPEITLQFLKSAVYYFLTDRENSQGHLKAIQSILGFTSNEISNIDKARLT